ncbi:glycolate oxidase subunit GlcD [Aetokthonos hydrillicola Thurmond2011]|jgi:glycolate oxidase|uniref:Glycolate oxidase subunit GlcD n=1 Tax=Aetokthonos hydrillicola Thurmond2011 TaxID=2712845 RepID=A0AAP5IB07_9CYAN|nr:glycolate oxidase subunit GlcD [Aetokthonos hydrillicola]MBO3463830.1 glycolate oxidase subunit GlcD [Aetokthonos hydrillicola CCALA 1050]MBW4588922.1 glycolate oxidase subunit GlcD [Aetokthonos hydrillicola CCALA 1050]MDR9898252.1 glycolate oxidase subunit GlcD [Aetokthonos hydrillicola Thurmond2011]
MLTQDKQQRNWKPIIKQFEAVVGKNGVVQRREELITYECDGLTSYRQRPAVVVLPRTTEQVAELVKICDRHSVPFIARGAGTGLSGGALPIEECVLIVTSLMRQILNVDLENQRIVVQPGVINNWVTQAVSGAGFYYAPDPSSQIICSIGGNVAENSGGVHCLKYGVTTNHVLGLKLVLPDGSIVDVGGQIQETPGYDLTGIFVGSEGTLGIATEITLRILKTAESICVLLADFTNVEDAGASVSDIISAGIIPGGMEIMDNISINAVEDVVATNCYPRDAAAILLVEIDGLAVEVAANKERIAEICKNNGARNITTASDPEQRLKLWKGRKAAFAAAGHLSPDYYVQDGVIPRTQLPYVLGEIEAISQKYGYRIANVFHAGDGNLHPLVLYDNSVPGALEKVEEVGGEILKLCVKVGGSISGEHGVGADKKCYMPEMFTEVDLETMQWVREVFNPKGLANPGKIFPTPRTCGEAANAMGANIKQFEGLERF